LGPSKSNGGKKRLQVKKLSKIETSTMVKGPGHVAKYKPPLEHSREKSKHGHKHEGENV
jgi:hypothetical protein